MLQVSQLFIYPVKSLGGILLTSSLVTDRGLQYDRRWMLVDDKAQFLTQREHPQMALLQVQITENGLLIHHKLQNDSILVPFDATEDTLTVEVWSNRCKAQVYDRKINEWLSHYLAQHCQLVYMPETTRRRVDGRYAHNKEITSFSDAFPFMMIGQSSLDDLNSRLQEQLFINRFRPNIVFTGGQPYEEDNLEHFAINDIQFYGVKRCARCVVTTINQDTAQTGKEPLKTLATYRKWNNKIYFGQNLLHHGSGRISVGDVMEVKRENPKNFYSRIPYLFRYSAHARHYSQANNPAHC